MTAALAICLTAVCIVEAQAQDEPVFLGYSVDELVDLYVELALRTEAGTGAQADVALIKWNPDSVIKIIAQPVGAFIAQNDLADALVDEIKRVSDIIASHTSHQQIVALNRSELLQFVKVARTSGPDIFQNTIAVLISDRAELVDRIQVLSEESPDIVFLRILLSKIPAIDEPICAGWTTKKALDDRYVYHGFVVIEYSSRVTSCLYEEIMQSFGIQNDFPDGTPSIFNDDNVYSEPTELDWFLWRVHFDPRLTSGMTEAEVRPIARDIISELILDDRQ